MPLLLEDGSYLLLEDGTSRLLLEDEGSTSTPDPRQTLLGQACMSIFWVVLSLGALL